MLDYLDAELRSSPAQDFYDGRIVTLTANSGKAPSVSGPDILLAVEGPYCDRLLFVRFNQARGLCIGNLDLLSLPDLLMLEFSDARPGYQCTIHFTSTDQEITFSFDSVEFSTSVTLS